MMLVRRIVTFVIEVDDVTSGSGFKIPVPLSEMGVGNKKIVEKVCGLSW